jgi:alanyl-tRNA synthetase
MLSNMALEYFQSFSKPKSNIESPLKSDKNKRSMKDIRSQFLGYFEKNQHLVIPSSSLVPSGDSTLLFNNAGMNQFKDVFAGKEKSKTPRAVTAQKCMRAGGKHNDLENVGYTKRHHTFFEMLGNFSFGDYFKEKAIELAWTFITKELALPQDRLYVTVFNSDDEAFNLWNKKIGIDPKRIFRFGEKDNFWAMGDTGPCGPCSEIFFDLAPDGKLPTKEQFLAQDDRFLEFWNLVFMEFLQHKDGSREKLPKPSIDTGAGLERVTAILSGVDNNYDTFLFKPILEYISDHSSVNYWKSSDENQKVSQKVIADHIRAISFLIADGVVPSKDGRGYVLRRIMRRAMRHGRKINFAEHGLSDLSSVVVQNYSSAYPELTKHQTLIKNVIREEEDKFSSTVDRGIILLTSAISEVKEAHQTTLKGDVAFQLYDTYGFPADLTADVLREHGLTLDQPGFDLAFENHREKARGSWKGSKGKEIETLVSKWSGQGIETTFLGYDQLIASGTILALVQDGKEISEGLVDQEVEVLADQTPFYGESGGQVGDIGSITGNGFVLDVIDTVKPSPTIFIHRCRVVEGKVAPKATAEFCVNEKARMDTAKNHTATHILHATLKEVLGNHVQQKGSLVSPERLRFDFTNPGPVTPAQLSKIEEIINERIWKNATATLEKLPYQKAVDTGAVALFGEKYGDEVRVLSIGDYSKELCGGTHLTRTCDIGMFKIVKETSVSAGIRRIEAFTSQRAFRFLSDMQKQMLEVSQQLGVPSEQISQRIEKLVQAQKDARKGVVAKHASVSVDEGSIQKIGNVSVYEQVMDVENPKDLRDIADRCMEKLKSGVVVLGAKTTDKVFLVVKVSKDVSGIKAGDLVKQAASIVEGSGGGRDDFAQAGGTNISKLGEALTKIKSLIESSK